MIVNSRRLLREEESLEYTLAERKLSAFVNGAWDVLEPETELHWNWHHDLICEYLTAVDLGQIKRLIINVAPRSTKSLLTTVCFPDWTWVKKPSKRFLFGSYADVLATKHSIYRRNLIESPWFQAAWGDRFHLAGDLNKKTEFANNRTGQMKAAGIKGSIIGEGGDIIIIDDPHNPKSAESDLEREATLQNFDLAWSTRLNDKKTGAIIIVMQRLHHLDLTGHLIARNAGYEHVAIPSIAEKKTIIVFPISKKEKVREIGDIMHAERDGPDELAQAKKDLGTYGFVGQHQQSPTPRSGGAIKRSWLKFYKTLPEGISRKIQSWDLSFGESASGSYTVGQLWGEQGPNFYFLSQTRDQMGFTEQISAIRAMSYAHPDAFEKVVEKKANGAAVLDTLEKEISGLIKYEPKTSKEARLDAVAPIWEAGNVWLPDPSIAPWIEDFITELMAFPKAAHNDQVDAMTQALLRLRGSIVGEFSSNLLKKKSATAAGGSQW